MLAGVVNTWEYILTSGIINKFNRCSSLQLRQRVLARAEPASSAAFRAAGGREDALVLADARPRGLRGRDERPLQGGHGHRPVKHAMRDASNQCDYL